VNQKYTSEVAKPLLTDQSDYEV